MRNELIAENNPKSSVSEAIKTIRTNLQFSSSDKKIKNILVTSSRSGEGKSFIAANLAVAFAQAGLKVLIVDCDMRRGRQHEIFGVKNDVGLSNLFLDDIKSNCDDYIVKTKVDGIYLIPMGIVPPNPSELLASNKNKELVQLLAKKFDLVIYDGVPIIGLADSVIMAELVDKIIVVCEYNETPLELLQTTKKGLEAFKDKIAGVVLNKFPSKGNKYYSSYYYTK